MDKGNICTFRAVPLLFPNYSKKVNEKGKCQVHILTNFTESVDDHNPRKYNYVVHKQIFKDHRSLC